jgi:hypothetical protein
MTNCDLRLKQKWENCDRFLHHKYHKFLLMLHYNSYSLWGSVQAIYYLYTELIVTCLCLNFERVLCWRRFSWHTGEKCLLLVSNNTTYNKLHSWITNVNSSGRYFCFQYCCLFHDEKGWTPQMYTNSKLIILIIYIFNHNWQNQQILLLNC